MGILETLHYPQPMFPKCHKVRKLTASEDAWQQDEQTEYKRTSIIQVYDGDKTKYEVAPTAEERKKQTTPEQRISETIDEPVEKRSVTEPNNVEVKAHPKTVVYELRHKQSTAESSQIIYTAEPRREEPAAEEKKTEYTVEVREDQPTVEQNKKQLSEEAITKDSSVESSTAQSMDSTTMEQKETESKTKESIDELEATRSKAETDSLRKEQHRTRQSMVQRRQSQLPAIPEEEVCSMESENVECAYSEQKTFKTENEKDATISGPRKVPPKGKQVDQQYSDEPQAKQVAPRRQDMDESDNTMNETQTKKQPCLDNQVEKMDTSEERKGPFYLTLIQRRYATRPSAAIAIECDSEADFEEEIQRIKRIQHKDKICAENEKETYICEAKKLPPCTTPLKRHYRTGSPMKSLTEFDCEEGEIQHSKRIQHKEKTCAENEKKTYICEAKKLPPCTTPVKRHYMTGSPPKTLTECECEEGEIQQSKRMQHKCRVSAGSMKAVPVQKMCCVENEKETRICEARKTRPYATPMKKLYWPRSPAETTTECKPEANCEEDMQHSKWKQYKGNTSSFSIKVSPQQKLYCAENEEEADACEARKMRPWSMPIQRPYRPVSPTRTVNEYQSMPVQRPYRPVSPTRTVNEYQCDANSEDREIQHTIKIQHNVRMSPGSMKAAPERKLCLEENEQETHMNRGRYVPSPYKERRMNSTAEPQYKHAPAQFKRGQSMNESQYNMSQCIPERKQFPARRCNTPPMYEPRRAAYNTNWRQRPRACETDMQAAYGGVCEEGLSDEESKRKSKIDNKIYQNQLRRCHHIMDIVKKRAKATCEKKESATKQARKEPTPNPSNTTRERRKEPTAYPSNTTKDGRKEPTAPPRDTPSSEEGFKKKTPFWKRKPR